MTTIRNTTQELGAISWSLFMKETPADASLGHLLQLIEQRKQIASNDPIQRSLGPIYESLFSEEGVLLYQDCVMVPHPYTTKSYRIYMQLIKEPSQ